MFVYFVKFEDDKLSDCNAIFSSKVGALAYFFSVMEKHKGDWHHLNHEENEDGDNVFTFHFWGREGRLSIVTIKSYLVH